MASRKRSASGSPGIVYAKKSKPAPLPCENRVLLNERMEELEEGEDAEIQLKLNKIVDQFNPEDPVKTLKKISDIVKMGDALDMPPEEEHLLN